MVNISILVIDDESSALINLLRHNFSLIKKSHMNDYECEFELCGSLTAGKTVVDTKHLMAVKVWSAWQILSLFMFNPKS
jgi:hypothetical protein